MLLPKLLKYFKLNSDEDEDSYIEKSRESEYDAKCNYADMSSCSNILLADIRNHCNKPFFIDYPMLQYENFTYIPFSKENESICIRHIKSLNILIRPLKKYTESTLIPEQFWCKKNPNPFLDYYPSQIRFTPFTKSGRIAKYPVSAFISNMTELYGNYGIQHIYYKQNGNIGKADCYYQKNKDTFFKIQIREKNSILYVRRIDKVYQSSDSNFPVPYLKTEIQYMVE